MLDTPGEGPVQALAVARNRSYARRMTMPAGMPAGMPAALPVGAPVRDRAGRALLGATLLGVAFTVFAALTTQDRAVRAHSPWQDDPYDALVSFTQLLVPVMVAAAVALLGSAVVAWVRLRAVVVPGGRDAGPDWAADAGALLRWVATRVSPLRRPLRWAPGSWTGWSTAGCDRARSPRRPRWPWPRAGWRAP